MGRHRKFIIKETLEELQEFKTKVRSYQNSQQLKALLLIKEGKLETLSEVAIACDVHDSTLQRWIATYKNNGIEQLLKPVKRRKPSKIITPEIHDALESRLTNPDNPFSGYVEVQEWLQKEHGVEIEYQWLWKYMKTKLNSVLKVPRKSNIKKDKEAEDSFFKTALYANSN